MTKAPKTRNIDRLPCWARTAIPAAAGVAVGLLLLALFGAPDREAPPRTISGKVDRPAAAPPASVVLPPAAPAQRVPLAQRPQASPPPAAAEPAWRRNAIASETQTGMALVAIIIDDMGLDRRAAQAMAALRGPLTLSYLPYAADLPAQTRTARAAGHELMVHVPMEPDHPEASVPASVLSVDLSPAEAMRRLDWALGRFDGFVGVNNHMGSRFTADAGHMRPVLAELKRRGLLFVDSRTSSRTVAPAIARGLGLPFASRDVFLDHDDDTAAIRARLRELEEVAQRNGHAVAIAHPRERTLAALREWLPTMESRGLALVPVSAIVQRAGPAQGAKDPASRAGAGRS